MDGRRLREHHRRFVPGVDGFRHLQADEEPAAGGQDRGGIDLFRRLGDETPALARIPFASFGLRSPPQGVGYLRPSLRLPLQILSLFIQRNELAYSRRLS
ncbi:hypothetical protein U8Q02_08365 [Rhizobium leguminosarum]|nr:hypothetical protein U8Q02_08365 [Rhizobium leguminosarum]